MDDSLRIDLELDNSKASAAFDEIIAKMQSLDATMKGVGKTMNTTSSKPPIITALNNQGQAVKGLVGPYQQLTRAQDNLKKALASGDKAAIADAKIMLRRAQSAVSSANNPATLSTIGRLAGGYMGGRVGAAVSHAADTLGFSELLPVIGATAAAFGALAYAVVSAANHLNALGSAGFSAGSSMGGANALGGIGAALGIGVEGAGKLANTIGRAMNSGGMAMSDAANMGIDPIGGRFGDRDYGRKLIEALRQLSDTTKYSSDEAVRIADEYGITDQVALLRNASPEVRNQVLNQNLGMSQEQLTAAADAQLQYNMALSEFQKAVTEFGGKALPVITNLINALNIKPLPLQIYDKIKGWITGDDGTSDKDHASAATDANTDAVKKNTKAIYDIGYFGPNGQRTMGAYHQGAGAFSNMDVIRRGEAIGYGAIV